MSVYAVTNDNRLLQFSPPWNKQVWLGTSGDHWHVYYKTCACASCDFSEHKALIAYVKKSTTVSIGFERPAAVEGRMLTYSERYALTDVAAWLRKRKLPKKMVDAAAALESIAKLTEQK